ncbi:MAG TPA: beta-ketoacyl synthase N-terminal-like domain-containing protein, partial [Candidatus Binatus sp.]|nr:beta-ketoacyl synthase N-terminal-like domain-containing protein [Candidatus Binatus sp.]
MLPDETISTQQCQDESAKEPMKRRVVITGMGAVSPNGVGTAEFSAALRAGVSGVRTISRFDPEDLACQVAGEVKNFRPKICLPPQELRRVGRAVPLLLSATQEALEQAGFCWQRESIEEKQSWGVILGSGGGTPDFTEEQYRLFFSEQLRRVSAYNVSSSTPGSLASEVSLYFGLRGPSHLISTGCTSSTDALGYAFNMIRFGLADRLVSGGADATITPGIMQGFCVMRVVS